MTYRTLDQALIYTTISSTSRLTERKKNMFQMLVIIITQNSTCNILLIIVFDAANKFINNIERKIKPKKTLKN